MYTAKIAGSSDHLFVKFLLFWEITESQALESTSLERLTDLGLLRPALGMLFVKDSLVFLQLPSLKLRTIGLSLLLIALFHIIDVLKQGRHKAEQIPPLRLPIFLRFSFSRARFHLLIAEFGVVSKECRNSEVTAGSR
jgi:hypothetical protein